MIRVVKRTFDVLEYLAKDPEANSRLMEIASAADLNASTCVRILKTLTNLGYVGKGTQRGRYSLGLRAYSMAFNGPLHRNLVAVSRPILSRLAEKLNETVVLTTLYQGRRAVLYEVEANKKQQQFRNGIILDYDNPLCTASGRLMLAHLPHDELENIIEEIENLESHWPGVKTEAELNGALQKIRNNGWASIKNESEIVGMAVPLKKDGILIAALGTYMYSVRFSKDREIHILQEIQLAAELLEKALSGDHPGSIH